MINLLPTSVVGDARLTKIKRQAATAATVILVGYILLLAGLGGRSWYLSSREKTVSAEVTGLTSQVSQLAEVEAVLRQQSDRVKLIGEALSGRVSLAQTAGLLSTATVTAWDYLPAGVQNVTAMGADAAGLEAYAVSLRDKFPAVTVKTLALKPDGQWQIVVQLVGGKP